MQPIHSGHAKTLHATPDKRCAAQTGQQAPTCGTYVPAHAAKTPTATEGILNA
ncbi:hypothetical protein EDD52_106118 [Primorskyibacter sedentarius]|uniref:Uncharacterized protein n=1 Tax=Primorskyibacter sedentarius TaxID=745311 RepID=A0A4R3JGI6_9RHOB|nr:hypothetical protein EDD52_106118 [Primorskyibacter sedentarius]